MILNEKLFNYKVYIKLKKKEPAFFLINVNSRRKTYIYYANYKTAISRVENSLRVENWNR